MKKVNFFFKTQTFLSCACLHLQRKTPNHISSTFETSFFSYHLIFPRKKLKINRSIFFSYNPQLFPSDNEELLLVLFLLSWIFEANYFAVSNNFSPTHCSHKCICEVVRKKRRGRKLLQEHKKRQTTCGTTTESENRHLLLLSKMTLLMKMIMQTQVEAN